MASAIFPYSVAIACITFIVSLLYPLHLPSLPYSYANHFCCCRFIVWLSNSIEYRRRVKCAAIQRTLYKQQQACTLRSHLYVDLNVFRGNASFQYNVLLACQFQFQFQFRFNFIFNFRKVRPSVCGFRWAIRMWFSVQTRIFEIGDAFEKGWTYQDIRRGKGKRLFLFFIYSYFAFKFRTSYLHELKIQAQTSFGLGLAKWYLLINSKWFKRRKAQLSEVSEVSEVWWIVQFLYSDVFTQGFNYISLLVESVLLLMEIFFNR